MARRRTSRKKTTRRRTPKAMINVLNTAEGYIVASAVTQGLFGTNLIKFATEGWLTPKTSGSVMGAGNSWSLSAQELIMSLMGDNSHMAQNWQDMGGVTASIRKNLTDNGGKALATIVLAPVAFKAGKRIARNPIRQMNKGIKALGLASTIKI